MNGVLYCGHCEAETEHETDNLMSGTVYWHCLVCGEVQIREAE